MDQLRICGPSLSETSLCDAYLYMTRNESIDGLTENFLSKFYLKITRIIAVWEKNSFLSRTLLPIIYPLLH